MTWKKRCLYRVFKKNIFIENMSLQIHPKYKSWGCFGKFRIFATRWALRFPKLRKKWLRKCSLKLPTPFQKWAKFTPHSMHFFCVIVHFHDLQWKQNLFHVGRKKIKWENLLPDFSGITPYIVNILFFGHFAYKLEVSYNNWFNFLWKQSAIIYKLNIKEYKQ